MISKNAIITTIVVILILLVNDIITYLDVIFITFVNVIYKVYVILTLTLKICKVGFFLIRLEILFYKF